LLRIDATPSTSARKIVRQAPITEMMKSMAKVVLQ
jgi:hypothetical protein